MTAGDMTPREPRVFRVATIGGTTVDVRISFLVLAGAFVLINLDGRVPLQYALLWIPVLFVSVLVHELAHAGTIAAFGYGASSIELGGWGGETMNRRNAKPWHEVLISLAGPASSIALAYLLLWLVVSLELGSANDLLVEFLRLMILANRAWGIFNLLPIVPLDGGQIVLHGLRHMIRPVLAFTIATWVSIVLGGLLGLAAAFLWKAWFIAIVAASLVMQNWARWQEFERYRAARETPSTEEDPRPG
jgi:Zn-dependent protease